MRAPLCLITTLFLAGCDRPAAPTTGAELFPPSRTAAAVRPAAETVAVDMTTLHTDYVRNPVLADARYRNRRLRVDGMGKVRQDDRGRSYFGFHVQLQSEGGDVRAFIAGDALAGFAVAFRDTDRVVIEGTCRGKVRAWDAWEETAVLLEDCRLISRTPHAPPPKP
jgi:tRNA_anti-like